MRPDPLAYRERVYRAWHRQDDLVHFQVAIKESDLDVGVRREVFTPDLARRTAELVRRVRRDIEDYIASDPVFATTLEPHAVPETAPAVVRAMAAAAASAGVGPMAAVAGAVAEWVGRALTRLSRDVVVENGGDIYLRSRRGRLIGVFAGPSPFTSRLALEIAAADASGGLGVCTSSGTVGPSLSFGRADAAVVVARCSPLADAVATAAGNRVRGRGDEAPGPADLEAAVDYACSVPGVLGALVIVGENLFARGRLTLRPVGSGD